MGTAPHIHLKKLYFIVLKYSLLRLDVWFPLHWTHILWCWLSHIHPYKLHHISILKGCTSLYFKFSLWRLEVWFPLHWTHTIALWGWLSNMHLYKLHPCPQSTAKPVLRDCIWPLYIYTLLVIHTSPLVLVFPYTVIVFSLSALYALTLNNLYGCNPQRIPRQ